MSNLNILYKESYEFNSSKSDYDSRTILKYINKFCVLLHAVFTYFIRFSQ